MVLSAVILPGCGMAPHDGVQRLGDMFRHGVDLLALGLRFATSSLVA